MLISNTCLLLHINTKAIIFGNMMQQVIFLSTLLERGSIYLLKKVLYSDYCIERFLKAIVFLHKKGSTFFQFIESQHLIKRNVGFLFRCHSNFKIQYLRR